MKFSFDSYSNYKHSFISLFSLCQFIYFEFDSQKKFANGDDMSIQGCGVKFNGNDPEKYFRETYVNFIKQFQ